MTIQEVDERIDMKLGIVLEHMDHKFEQLLEAVDMMINKKLEPVANDVAALKNDMEVVKVTIQETNRDVKDLQKRVARLEAAN